MVFYKPESFETDEFIQQLIQKFNAENVGNRFVFNSKSSFSKLPVKVYLQVIDDNTSVQCKYKISMFENNTVFISTIVFALFFYFNNSANASILPIIFGLGYFLTNTSRISHSIKSEIYNLLGSNIDYGMVDLWKKQKQWMKDPLLCPACGEPKNKYSNACVNCGLQFNKAKQKLSKTNTSSSQKKLVNYELLKKKK